MWLNLCVWRGILGIYVKFEISKMVVKAVDGSIEFLLTVSKTSITLSDVVRELSSTAQFQDFNSR